MLTYPSPQPEIMQHRAEEKNSFYEVVFPLSALIFDYPILFHTTNFYEHMDTGHGRVGVRGKRLKEGWDNQYLIKLIKN